MTQNNPAYCAMIHGGLNINLKNNPPLVKACCIRQDQYSLDSDAESLWNHPNLVSLRDINVQGQWDPGCFNCERLERAGSVSLRQGMNQGLGIDGRVDLSGPARLDIMFDISCNLACRTCGPWSSTFWQKSLKDTGAWPRPVFTPRYKKDMIDHLAKLDLSNLRQVIFCGGETLLGNEYWDVAHWLVHNVPNAKHQLELCFQTNGTQPISQKNYEIIDACRLVKLQVSMDGTGPQFEYLRWPAKWDQVTGNLLELKLQLPSNVMFLFEQTVSVFNILDLDRVDQWVSENFATNREGDPTTCTRHLANGMFGLDKCSQELITLLHDQQLSGRFLVSQDWKENPALINFMISNIKKFDQHRGQSLVDTFPKVAAAYHRYW